MSGDFFVSLFDHGYGVGSQMAARAMSDAEIAQMQLAQAQSTMNAPQWTLEQLSAMQGYRRPVSVPQGIADWYLIGDELH